MRDEGHLYHVMVGTTSAADLPFDDASLVVRSLAGNREAFGGIVARYVRAGPIGDSLAANAYGMYLIHYPCVSWLQYFLLGAAFSGAV